MKSVQGDSGHERTQMVTDQYSHIPDEGRKNSAELFETAFYSGKEQKLSWRLQSTDRCKSSEAKVYTESIA